MSAATAISAPSPEDFAEDLTHETGIGNNEFSFVAKEERGELDQLISQMEDAYPGLKDVSGDSTWSRLQDAITRTWVATHRAGVREGAAAENLRREMIAVRAPTGTPASPPTPKPSARFSSVAESIERKRAILSDPIKFAETMMEPIFLDRLDDLFSYDRAPIRHLDDLIKAAQALTGPAQQRALRDLDNASADVIGDMMHDVGIPMGVAIERIRCALVECVERMDNPRVPYPNLERYTA